MSFTQDNMHAMISNIYTTRQSNQPITETELPDKICEKILQLERKIESQNLELKEAFLILEAEVLSIHSCITSTINEIKNINTELSTIKQYMSYIAHDALSIHGKTEQMELKINLSNSKLSTLNNEIESLKKYVVLL